MINEIFDNNENSDTIGADLSDFPLKYIPELKLKSVLFNLGKSEGISNLWQPLGSVSTPKVNFEPALIDGHRLFIPDLDLEYVYELHPRVIDGRKYFEYGISATANKTDYEGFIIHHMSDSPFDNCLEYTQRRDATRTPIGTYGYHFLIGRDGRAVQAAPLSKRTNHISSSSSVRSAQTHLKNRNTIGISFHDGYYKEGKSYIRKAPSTAQIAVGKIILQALSDVYGVGLENTWGNGEIQSNRMPEEGHSLYEWARGNNWG